MSRIPGSSYTCKFVCPGVCDGQTMEKRRLDLSLKNGLMELFSMVCFLLPEVDCKHVSLCGLFRGIQFVWVWPGLAWILSVDKVTARQGVVHVFLSGGSARVFLTAHNPSTHAGGSEDHRDPRNFADKLDQATGSIFFPTT